MNWEKQALETLKAERAAASYDKYAKIMQAQVHGALADFCRQDEEFAQAVVQGGTFEECMKAVAKNCGSGISDLEAFRRAARFYFPGAEVRFQMSIDLCGRDAADGEAQGQGGPVLLNLEDFWQEA